MFAYFSRFLGVTFWMSWSMANTGCAGSAIAVAPIWLNVGITAPVLSCVITWRGRIEMKSPARTTVPAAGPSACRAAIFSTSVRPISGPTALLRQFRRSLADDFSQRNVHGFGVGENLGDIRLQDNDVRSLCITARVFSALTLREIILVPHRFRCGFIRCFLHRICVLAGWRVVR